MSGAVPRPVWRGRALWLVLWLVLAAVLAYGASRIDWGQVRAALRQADPLWVFIAFLANLSALPLWGLALRQFIPAGEPQPYGRIVETLALTTAATQTLSVFAGGATAALLLARRVGLSTGAMISTITLEQVTTGIVKSLIVGAAMTSAFAPGSMAAAGGLLMLAILCAFTGLLWAAHSGPALQRIAIGVGGRAGRLIALLADWTAHLETLRRPWRLAAGIGFTACRRVMEGLGVLCIQRACGIPVSPELALLIIAALSLATIIPGPPGNMGIFEAAVVVAYGWAGFGAETAVAAALLQHFAYLAAALMPGYLLFALGRWRNAPAQPR